MRFYLDTEFNGFGGKLISLALIGNYRHVGSPHTPRLINWYAAQWIGETYHPWVAEHVVPVLTTPLLEPVSFRRQFHGFVSRWGQVGQLEIVCDWPADAAHFCEMLAGEDYGSSLDLSCSIKIVKTPRAPDGPKSLVPHNALADATALMEWHQQVEKFAA